MKKRVLSAALAATMVATLLAGCGGNSSNGGTSGGDGGSGNAGASTSEDGSKTVTQYGEYTEENPYHLTFAYIEFAQQDANATKAVQDALNDYMRPTYHMEVEFLPMQFAEYQSQLQLMFSGSDALDVMPIYYTNASSWLAMNAIVDMMPYMETEDGKAIEEVLGANTYVGQMNGVLFGFPAQKESVELGGLFMRKDICDELGITEEYDLKAADDEYKGVVYDWSEATKIFEKVKAAYPDMVPLYLQGNSSAMRRFAFFDELADQFGVLDWETDHDTTTVVNEFETEAYKEAVTRLAEWFDAGYIYKDAMTDTQGAGTMMKAGNTFSYPTAIKPGLLTEAKAATGCEGYVMYFEDQIEGGYSTTNVSFFDCGIANNSQDPDMAFKFIRALYTDAKVMNFWQNGIEGVNYQVLDDGTAYFVDGEDASNYKYHQNTGWYQGNQFISYVWNDGTKTPDYWELLQTHNTWADYSPAYGFMWDASEYSANITALQNALETYRPALETGDIGGAGNVDNMLKQLNDALYAAGLQDVMDAKQAQLDSWLEANGPTETPAENQAKIDAAYEAAGTTETKLHK